MRILTKIRIRFFADSENDVGHGQIDLFAGSVEFFILSKKTVISDREISSEFRIIVSRGTAVI